MININLITLNVLAEMPVNAVNFGVNMTQSGFASRGVVYRFETGREVGAKRLQFSKSRPYASDNAINRMKFICCLGMSGLTIDGDIPKEIQKFLSFKHSKHFKVEFL